MPRVAPEANVIQPHRHGVGARHHAAATAKPAEFVALLGETDDTPTASPSPQGSLLAAASGLPASIQPNAPTGDAQPSIVPQIAENTDCGSEDQSAATPPPAPAATADTDGGTEVKEKASKLEDATISAIDDVKPAGTDTGPPAPTSDGTAPAQAVVVAVAPAQVAAIAAPPPAAVPITDVPVANGPVIPAGEPASDRAAIIAELAPSNAAAAAGTRGAPPEGAGRPAAEDGKGQPPRKGAAGLSGIEARSSGNNATKAVHAKPGGGTDDAAPAAGGDEQDDPRVEAKAGPNAPPSGQSEVARARPVRAVGAEAEQKLGETSIRPPAETQADGAADRSVTQLAVLQQPGERAANVVAAAAPAGGYAAGSIATAVPIAGLALQIAARAQAGSNRFEIRLDPPELGRIDVRLDVDREGRVSSRLVAEKAETLELLRREAPELERALQQAGLKTSDNGMQFTLRDQSFGGANQDSRDSYWGAAAKLVVQDPEMDAVDSLPGNRDRSLQLGTGIDIRV